MDASKLRVLRELPYRILPTCGLCTHSSFHRASEWGTCRVHTYQHERHTGDLRKLSISIHGTCPSFQMDEGALDLLEGFAELIDQ